MTTDTPSEDDIYTLDIDGAKVEVSCHTEQVDPGYYDGQTVVHYLDRVKIGGKWLSAVDYLSDCFVKRLDEEMLKVIAAEVADEADGAFECR